MAPTVRESVPIQRKCNNPFIRIGLERSIQYDVREIGNTSQTLTYRLYSVDNNVRVLMKKPEPFKLSTEVYGER